MHPATRPDEESNRYPCEERDRRFRMGPGFTTQSSFRPGESPMKIRFNDVVDAAPGGIVLPAAPRRTHATDLPFVIRLARTDDQLRRAASVRAEAYGRHVPSLARLLTEPEPVDRQRGTVVFLAEAKDDGAAVGTIRIQTNRAVPLRIEESVELPDELQDRMLVEVTRLAVVAGRRGALVKYALFKALHRFCLATQVDWMVIGARPPLDRGYRALDFQDLVPDGAPVPLRHSNDIPHHVLGFEVISAERRWREQRHPLYDFMCGQFHPDIAVFASVSSVWDRPRGG